MKTLTQEQMKNSKRNLMKNAMYYGESSLDNRADLIKETIAYTRKSLEHSQAKEMVLFITKIGKRYLGINYIK